MASLNTLTPKSSLTELNQLYDEFWEFYLKQFPRRATYLGDHRYDDRLEDASAEAFQNRISQYQAYLEQLGSMQVPDSPSDRLNYDLFERRLKLDIEGAKFRPYLTPITQQTGPHIDVPQLITYQPFQTVQDYENYFSRLSQFPRLINQAVENMRTGIRDGIVLARITVEAILPQLEVHIVEDPKRSEFYKPAATIPDTVPKGDADIVRANLEDAVSESVVPAYSNLRDFVSDEYLPASRGEEGIWSLPDGEERYSYYIRYYTTTDYSPERIHGLGLEELARIRREMEEIVKRVGFNGTLQDYIGALRNNSSMYYPSGEQLLAGFREILKAMDEKLSLLFGRLPKAQYGFREIEAYRAEAAPDAYYYRPPADGSRPGYFYVNTNKPETRPKYTMEALAYHEAVPGHHLQIAVQQELTHLPKFRRFGGYTAFVEGWALYSERLPRELGLYSDPASDFGRLTFDALRAARLVVDTGIHYKRWTREQAIRFMEESALQRSIVSEVDRYIAWPGQALAYKIGQLKISELREKAEKQLGSRFDLRAFHDEILCDGALALDVLDKKMERWLAAQTEAQPVQAPV